MNATANSIEGNGPAESNTTYTFQKTKTNPMLLSPVMECICGFLNVEDIKQCRLVSLEWSLNLKSIIRKRSKIILYNKKSVDYNFSISEFFEDFYGDGSIPFTAFKFKNGAHWKVRELNEFFKSQQGNIKELELDRLQLVNEEEKKIEKFSISPWISKSLMTKAITKSTKLSVTCRSDGFEPATELSVLLSALSHVKDISLEGVEVNIGNGGKMRPHKLKLDKVKFCSRNRTEVRRIRINDIVDFSYCKSVHLGCGYHRTKITLDLSGNGEPVHLENLTIQGYMDIPLPRESIMVINWLTSTWTVTKLNVVCIPLMEKCGMEIVDLDFFKSDIDLSCLPPSIEKLSLHGIGGYGGTYVICTQMISLPNLRFLYLNFTNTVVPSIVSHFKTCSRLVAIDLDGFSSFYYYRMDSYWLPAKNNCKKKLCTLTLKFHWIPKSVKLLKFTRVPILWEEIGNEILLLDRLILNYYSYKRAKVICIKNIQVKEIVLYNGPSEATSHRAFLDFLRYLNKRSHNVQRVFVGPFQWRGRSCMKNMVDKKAKYYVFENQRGRAMEETEFNNFRNVKLMS